MNKDQVNGRVDQTTGKVKEVAGRIVGNDRLEAEGRAEKTAGKVKTVYGDAKEDVKDSAKRVIDKI
ncbi:MAG TPA: CsbD family protein [Polaromonas sp.]|uniref:CsbD family protein n=1 Tax=Polaromonas sp. TaxID=1869339 RepID=UPI002D5732EF|nr:CsbD family protein [Polaromonas sp.]HYW56899.1 CsbD family protein [Polaromonas sp.]